MAPFPIEKLTCPSRHTIHSPLRTVLPCSWNLLPLILQGIWSYLQSLLAWVRSYLYTGKEYLRGASQGAHDWIIATYKAISCVWRTLIPSARSQIPSAASTAHPSQTFQKYFHQ